MRAVSDEVAAEVGDAHGGLPAKVGVLQVGVVGRAGEGEARGGTEPDGVRDVGEGRADVADAHLEVEALSELVDAHGLKARDAIDGARDRSRAPSGGP